MLVQVATTLLVAGPTLTLWIPEQTVGQLENTETWERKRKRERKLEKTQKLVERSSQALPASLNY